MTADLSPLSRRTDKPD
jgi:hypothetical protein